MHLLNVLTGHTQIVATSFTNIKMQRKNAQADTKEIFTFHKRKTYYVNYYIIEKIFYRKIKKISFKCNTFYLVLKQHVSFLIHHLFPTHGVKKLFL